MSFAGAAAVLFAVIKGFAAWESLTSTYCTVDVASVVAGAEIFHAVPGIELFRLMGFPLAPVRRKSELIVWVFPAPKVRFVPGTSAEKAVNVLFPLIVVSAEKATVAKV